MDINLKQLLKIKTGMPQGSVWGHFYVCCISTISLNVVFLLKWSCTLMILPCIVLLIVVTFQVQWQITNFKKQVACRKQTFTKSEKNKIYGFSYD